MLLRNSLSLIAAVAFALAARAEIRLPAIISDNMVLQARTNVKLWGWTRAGETVRIKPAWGDAVDATADPRGRWEANIATPEPGGPQTISFTSPTGSASVRNILIGEVWLCSGQSNMEWGLTQIGPGSPGVPGAQAEIAAAKFPTMRLFVVPNVLSAHPQIDCAGRWVECSPATVANFSAVGYFFGRELNQSLQHPIGLIASDWGGTPAQAWTSETALRELGMYAPQLDLLRIMRSEPAERDRRLNAMTAGWWDALDEASGLPQAWLGASFDDSAWQTMAIPASFSGPLGQFDGVVHLRASFDVPESAAGKEATLELGPIDDYDDAFINGTRVGSTHEPNQWATARRYTVPAGLLKAGRNVLAVRVLDTGGVGGVNGNPDQLRLAISGGPNVPLAGTWRTLRGVQNSKLPPRAASVQLNAGFPTVLHAGMIAPIAPYTLRGAIWYQGESNRDDAAAYARLFPAMIRDWRSLWRQGDFPFYFVQIAPFRYPGDAGQTAELREAQAAALKLSNTGMAVTLDIGNPDDIHPANKLDVGRRLARLALRNTYGKNDVVDSGPAVSGFSVQGDAVRVTFNHAAGLRVADNAVNFQIAGADKRFYKARARVDGDALIVHNPRVSTPVAVRYAWSAAPTGELFNGAGLPAAPFRTDDWKRPLPPVEDEGATEFLTSDTSFVPLFNGKDLTGWVNVNCAPNTFTAKDGRIYCTGEPTGVIRTDRQYENFVLEMEWRHLRAGGNAGLFVWSDALTARGQPFTRSVEVQVMDGLEGPGYTSDGDIFPIHGATMTPENGKGGQRAFPTQKRMRPSPEWNHYRVTCINGDITLAVNGADVTKGRQSSPRRGYICLESEGSPIEFRNLKIKVLPATEPPLPPAHVATAEEGFVPLYTGVDFAGWKFGKEHEGHWRAEDWTIGFDGQGTDLWTEKSYKNFVLIADWRWTAAPTDVDRPVILPSGESAKGPDGKDQMQRVADAGDSGIYLRGSSKSQVNIWCWPIGSGEVYGYRTDAAQPASVRAGVTPRERADSPNGQWNRFVITMRGEYLTVVLNGKTVLDKAHLPGVDASGPIGLQMHNSPIQFGNLFIKEID